MAGHDGILSKKASDIHTRLQEISRKEIVEVLLDFSSTFQGLTELEAKTRLPEYIANPDFHKTRELKFLRIAPYFFHLTIIVAASSAFYFDILTTRDRKFIPFVSLVILLFLSIFFSSLANKKASSTQKKLAENAQNLVWLLRNGHRVKLPYDVIVPGDVILLSPGDAIPADVRFLTTKDAFISQPAINGDSCPVQKTYYALNQNTVDNDTLTALENIGFAGSAMVSGSASALVLNAGKDTWISTQQDTPSSTEYRCQSTLTAISRIVVLGIGLSFFVLLFLSGSIRKDWPQALFFSLAFSAGLAPFLSNVLTTYALTKGAEELAEKGVNVRHSGLMQTLGEIDILCTDISGTLAKEVQLESYLNINGNKDSQILQYALWNSHFQTEPEDIFDTAINTRAKEEKISSLTEEYLCVGELPFDFSRQRKSVLLQDTSGRNQLCTIGDAGVILDISQKIETGGKISPLTAALKKKAKKLCLDQSKEGRHLFAVAKKNNMSVPDVLSGADETDMIFLGFLSFSYTPEETAEESLSTLQSLGIRTVLLTQAGEDAANNLMEKMGKESSSFHKGDDIDKMNDEDLAAAVQNCNLFVHMTPKHKEKVIAALQRSGHLVGYMGDQVSDSGPLSQADIRISTVQTTAASENANIILPHKDLSLLHTCILSGRESFSNTLTYIKTSLGCHGGSILSAIFCRIFFSFAPLLPVQILAKIFLCDLSRILLPFDRVDKEFSEKPQKWNRSHLFLYTLLLGIIGSVFDILFFLVMRQAYRVDGILSPAFFQCGWFAFSTFCQILAVHVIRTGKIPFMQSKPGVLFAISSLCIAVLPLVIAFGRGAEFLSMSPLPVSILFWMLALTSAYLVVVSLLTKTYADKAETLFRETLRKLAEKYGKSL